MRTARFASSLALTTATIALVVGCSAKDAAVAPSGVTLTFPSTEAAVASDGVRIEVFDESGVADLSAACQDLVAQVRSSQSLPTPLVDTSTTACALAAGTAPFTVDVGARAFLVTTTSSGTALLVGCTGELVEGGQLLVPVDLIPVSDSVTVPPTSCTTLSQFCGGGGC